MDGENMDPYPTHTVTESTDVLTDTDSHIILIKIFNF